MYLNKKSLRKIRALFIAYCILSVVCFSFFIAFTYQGVESVEILIISIVCILLAFAFRAMGRYAEGKGKLINEGHKLVFHQLHPAIFLRMYEEKRDCPDNVIAKPDFDVLGVVVTAYEALDETEKAYAIIEQMVSLANEKQMPSALLIKASMLYSMNRTEEAEALYVKVTRGKMDITTRLSAEIVAKSSRAKAYGDFMLAETYYIGELQKKSSLTTTPLTQLYSHYELAEIYLKTERSSMAIPHLMYCVENGGDIAVRTKADDILKNLQKNEA